MNVDSVLMLAAGAFLGVLIGYFLAKYTAADKSAEVGQLKAMLDLERQQQLRMQHEIDTQKAEQRSANEKLLALHGTFTALKAENNHLKQKLAEHKEEVTQLQQRFAAEFKNLANDIFEEKSRKFTDQNKSNLDMLLKPLGERLLNFEQKVDQSNKQTLQWNVTLKAELDQLRQLNQKITLEAENLTKALKGDTKVQGNWGELILERILENSGLEKDREYFTQESHTSEQGNRYRPDVIIRLPDDKNLIIDSKVSLVAYERFVNSENENDQSIHLKDHLLSIRNHIKSLSEKRYQELFATGSLDYVLMFVPIESAFALVVQHGGELYQEAHQKNIIIVSPTTLIATLRTVASIWKHEYQNRNALEIARQGGALYDKFKAFADDLSEVGRSLDRSKLQYNEAMKKLVDGKDNLVRKTERLRELGAKTSREISKDLLDQAGLYDSLNDPSDRIE